MPEQTFPVNSDDVLKVDASGYAVPVFEAPAASAAITSVTAAGGGNASTLLGVNTARKGATIFNASDSLLYVALGSVASTSNYTVQVEPQGSYELPPYTGGVSGLWAGATPTGAALITELS